MTDGPVTADPPTQRQALVDKNGVLTPYGHKLFTALWERTGGYDDEVFRALGLGFTGLTQAGQAQQQLAALEGSQRGLQGEVAALRGDPRLEAAGRAEKKADSATAIAMSRAPADTQREVEQLRRELARVQASLGALQAQLRQFMTASQDQISEAVKITGFSAGLQASQTQISLNEALQVADAVQDEVDIINSDFNVRVYSALSGTAPVTFNSGTGAIGLSLTAGDVTGALTYTPTSVTGLTGVQSVAAFKTGLSLVKGDVGLGNVDNTSDANKPVSTAQATAIGLKADTASPSFTGDIGINCTPPGGLPLRIQASGSNDVGIDYVRTASDTMALLAFDRNLGAYCKWVLAGKRIAFRYEGGTEFLVLDSTGLKAVLTTYADNAAALAGGLVATNLYKTATGEVRIVV